MIPYHNGFIYWFSKNVHQEMYQIDEYFELKKIPIKYDDMSDKFNITVVGG